MNTTKTNWDGYFPIPNNRNKERLNAVLDKALEFHFSNFDEIPLYLTNEVKRYRDIIDLLPENILVYVMERVHYFSKRCYINLRCPSGEVITYTRNYMSNSTTHKIVIANDLSIEGIGGSITLHEVKENKFTVFEEVPEACKFIENYVTKNYLNGN